MKVWFDVNVPRPLRLELPGYEVITAQAKGWGELENGELINSPETEHSDGMLTADPRLRHKQNLS